jgi:hypothetical protein
MFRLYKVFTPLGVNFNTKLASVFLVSCHWNNAEIKSAKVRKGQNLQFMKVVASFQEIERFTVAHRSLFVKMKRKVHRYSHRQNKKARLRTFLVWTNRRASVYAESNGLMGS